MSEVTYGILAWRNGIAIYKGEEGKERHRFRRKKSIDTSDECQVGSWSFKCSEKRLGLEI